MQELKTIGVAGQYGWIPDQKPQELPDNAWDDVLNVRFKDGELQSMLGQRQVFTTPTFTPYFLLAFTTSTLRYWLSCGLASASVTDGTNVYNITPASPFTGTTANKWSGGTINGYPVVNNGKDVPTYWDLNTANKLVTLPGWDVTERCAWLRTFKSYILSGGITKGATVLPNLLKWSDIAPVGGVPTSWDETDVTKDAGEQPLTGNDGVMVDGLQLNDAFVVYFERGMYLVQESFDSRIFTFRRLPGNDGLLAIGCVADTPAGHVVLTAGDVVIHQGQGTKSIAEARVRRWLFDNMDPTNRAQSFVFHNPRFKEVWVCIPTVGNTTPNRAAIYSYAYDNWTLRELPNVTCGTNGLLDVTSAASWDGQTDTWDNATRSWDGSDFPPNETIAIVGTTAPKLDIVDVGGTMSGASFTPYAYKTGYSGGDPNRLKFLTGLTPRLEMTAGAQVQILLGRQTVAERGASYDATITYTAGTSEPQADGQANAGRFLCWGIRSLGPQPWSLKSYDPQYVWLGRY